MAGARKSRRARSVQKDRARHNRYGKRLSGSENPRPIVIIACDDEKTAPAYFTELKREYKDCVTIDVVPKPHSYAGPDTVVGCAVAKLEDLKNAEDDYDRQVAWVLIDLEHTATQRREAEDAKAEGERQAIKVALSSPCFEVWTLLHLVDTGEKFAKCSRVIAKIERQWITRFNQEFGKKGQADFSKIIPLRAEAVKRARRHHTKTPRDPSWTEVYLVIEDIERLGGLTGQ